MKRRRTAALVVVLVLASLVALVSQLAGATPQGKYRPGPPPMNANVLVERGNENRGGERAANENGNARVGIPDSACRRGCRASYRRCLRQGKNRRSCERRLRNCYRRCPQ